MRNNISDIKLEVLLICDYSPSCAITIIDHISAFTEFSQHNIHILNMLGDLPNKLDLTKFHVVVIHYSICIVADSCFSITSRELIRNFQGLKIVYIQDDYRWIYKTLAMLDFMKVDAIFCLANQNIIDQVYIPNLIPTVRRRETVLAGYVTDALINHPKKKYLERTIDVGYRARKLSPCIGVHGIQKWKIAERFLHDAPNFNLRCDISYHEEDRIYGDKWLDFLSNCKSVLGTESGASLCDFTGEIQTKVDAHLAKYPNASFDELSNLYFKDDDCKIIMNVISPRFFEAAALKTLMVLYEGDYSGILKPYLHYVPLATDHHNIAEIVEYINDENKSKPIIERAYNDIILNPEYHYRKMITLFDTLVNEEIQFSYVNIKNPYSVEAFNTMVLHHILLADRHNIIMKHNMNFPENALASYIESIYIWITKTNLLSPVMLSLVRKASKPFVRILLHINQYKALNKIKHFILLKIRIYWLLNKSK